MIRIQSTICKSKDFTTNNQRFLSIYLMVTMVAPKPYSRNEAS